MRTGAPYRTLSTAEYIILQEQPLAAELACEDAGRCSPFCEFWDLPREVREAIAAYPGSPARFEVYCGERSDRHFLTFAISGTPGSEKVEFIAEYDAHALVPPITAVTHDMIEAARARSAQLWSLSSFAAREGVETVWLACGSLIVAACGWSLILFLGNDIRQHLLAMPGEAGVIVGFAGIGVLLASTAVSATLPLGLLVDWLRHHRHRSRLARGLASLPA